MIAVARRNWTEQDFMARCDRVFGGLVSEGVPPQAYWNHGGAFVRGQVYETWQEAFEELVVAIAVNG